jgi:hypothetical protein
MPAPPARLPTRRNSRRTSSADSTRKNQTIPPAETAEFLAGCSQLKGVNDANTRTDRPGATERGRAETQRRIAVRQQDSARQAQQRFGDTREAITSRIVKLPEHQRTLDSARMELAVRDKLSQLLHQLDTIEATQQELDSLVIQAEAGGKRFEHPKFHYLTGARLSGVGFPQGVTTPTIENTQVLEAGLIVAVKVRAALLFPDLAPANGPLRERLNKILAGEVTLSGRLLHF